jgi:hypothetical protein
MLEQSNVPHRYSSIALKPLLSKTWCHSLVYILAKALEIILEIIYLGKPLLLLGSQTTGCTGTTRDPAPHGSEKTWTTRSLVKMS